VRSLVVSCGKLQGFFLCRQPGARAADELPPQTSEGPSMIMTDPLHRDRPGLVPAGRAIEEQSFAIIEREIGSHHFPPEHWPVVRRVIHTTGDFDFAAAIRIHPQAVPQAVQAIRGGARIVTDTRMIRSGLSPWRLERYGNEVLTPAVVDGVRQAATDLGLTRSAAALRGSRHLLDGSIVAVGNAPTALLEMVRLIEEEGLRPALVIGVPVGFVQAVESKEALWACTAQPSITVLGRKGGSPVAVAIVHALLDLARA